MQIPLLRTTFLVAIFMLGISSTLASRETDFHHSGRVVNTPVRRMLKQYRPPRPSTTNIAARSGYGSDNKYSTGTGDNGGGKYNGGGNDYHSGSDDHPNPNPPYIDVPNVSKVTKVTSYTTSENDGGNKDGGNKGYGNSSTGDGGSKGSSYGEGTGYGNSFLDDDGYGSKTSSYTGGSSYDNTHSPPPPKPSSWSTPGYGSSGSGYGSSSGPYNRLSY